MILILLIVMNCVGREKPCLTMSVFTLPSIVVSLLIASSLDVLKRRCVKAFGEEQGVSIVMLLLLLTVLVTICMFTIPLFNELNHI